MKISRDTFSFYDKSDLVIVREQYPGHSFFYINFSIFAEGDVSQAIKKLSIFLDQNGYEVLTGFAFGLESFPSVSNLNKISGLVSLKQKDTSCHRIQLVCTDSSMVTVITNTAYATVKAVDHYGSTLFFITNGYYQGADNCYGQAYSAFKSLGKILNDIGIGCSNLVRTWLFVSDILEWYDTLNRARTDFYREENILDDHIPASTGIGLGNIYDKCLLINAFAVHNREVKQMVRTVKSPMQCDATDYKSSFSRAVELSLKTSKRLIISGTASIGRNGETLHKGSIKNQIKHTMEVVHSILTNEKYGWNNVVRAIAYFLYPEDVIYFNEYCFSNNIDSSGILRVDGTICRDDLLFEIELDAVKTVQH